MRDPILTASLLVLSIFTSAQTKEDGQAIKSLCGCFEVDFKYAETFSPVRDYQFSKPYHAAGLEWVTAEEATNKKWVIQHILVAGDSMYIKHWREDWEFEKKDWWMFAHDGSWNHVAADAPSVSGQWTQTVWEVDDAPRYQGTGRWINNNGKTYWENTTDAPLPRREYTKRSDYNVMKRMNRLIITDSGWVHEQDNDKILRKDGATDRLIAQEKGYNIYKKVDDSQCAGAARWWALHRPFWTGVRQSWSNLLKDRSTLHLLPKVEGKLLYEQLDVLEELHLVGENLQQQTKATVEKYVQPADGKSVAAGNGTNQ